MLPPAAPGMSERYFFVHGKTPRASRNPRMGPAVDSACNFVRVSTAHLCVGGAVVSSGDRPQTMYIRTYLQRFLLFLAP